MYLRYSSNGKIHVKTLCIDKILQSYDEERIKYGDKLGFYLLFDSKFGRKSGNWVPIRNLLDLMNFLY